ncbi:TIGR02449 family protein [Kaarinaea lacus]
MTQPTDIEKLETRIDELIELCDKLQNENLLLKDRQEMLVEERARLIEKTELAKNRVESMLLRLKGMEQEQ